MFDLKSHGPRSAEHSSQHLIICSDPTAIYKEDGTTGRMSVIMAYKTPQIGTEHTTYLLTFKCFLSCVGGLNRRQIQTVFTLENKYLSFTVFVLVGIVLRYVGGLWMLLMLNGHSDLFPIVTHMQKYCKINIWKTCISKILVNGHSDLFLIVTHMQKYCKINIWKTCIS